MIPHTAMQLPMRTTAEPSVLERASVLIAQSRNAVGERGERSEGLRGGLRERCLSRKTLGSILARRSGDEARVSASIVLKQEARDS